MGIREAPGSDARRYQDSIEAAWGLITLVIILGGILGGIFTAIEAGAVACVWAFFVTMFIYRDYKWRHFRPSSPHPADCGDGDDADRLRVECRLRHGAHADAGEDHSVFPDHLEQQNVILFLINILLLVLGCLVDMAPSILICTPILLPVMVNFGVDPVHFGMIMMLNLGIGLCHPPVGAILFVGCAVGKVTIEEVMRTIWPFYGVMFAVLMLVTYIPTMSLWLPHLLGL